MWAREIIIRLKSSITFPIDEQFWNELGLVAPRAVSIQEGNLVAEDLR
jgi:hypothetical protein